MGPLVRLLNGLRMLVRRKAADDDLEADLRAFLVTAVDEKMRGGMSRDEATRAARLETGLVSIDSVKECVRDAGWETRLESIWRDIRYAVRTLRKSPAFTAAAVLTLALGIGANTAIFSALDAILIRALPYTDPDRLVMVWEDATWMGFPHNTPAPGNYVEWTELNRAFVGIAATRGASGSLTADGPPEHVIGRAVTSNFFSILGVQPLLGRTFSEDDDRALASVVVISHGLWQRRYGGTPSILRQTLLMNGNTLKVIGVMPRDFAFRDGEIDYWIPFRSNLAPAAVLDRRSHYLNVVGRLKPGISVEAANLDMRRVSDSLKHKYPDTNARVTTVVVPLKADLLGDTGLRLLLLMGAAAAVLLIACANLASLLLSRGISRRSEFAVRAALGATRQRLIRQMIVESLALSLLGGVIGLAIAPAGMSLLAQLAPNGFPPVPASILDMRLLTFTFALSVTAALVFSVVPAIQAGGVSLVDAHQHGARAAVGGQRRRTRDVLVVLQIATALVLLAAAGLLIRTLANLRAMELGFRPDHVLTMGTPLPRARYSDPVQRLAFYDRVIARARTLPGVEGVAFGSMLPFASSGNTLWFQIDGIAMDPDDPADVLNRVGTPDYLKTLGVQLIEGRLLDSQDGPSAPLAIVINETMARKYWPTSPAVGHRIRFAPSAPFHTVVGVVKDVRERGYTMPMKPAVYFSAPQRPEWSLDSLVVRVDGDPASFADPIRRIVASIDPDQAVAAIRTMDEILDRNVADRRQHMTLLIVFAGLALLLASIGLYGVLSYAVAQRSGEFGVRIVLGASPGSIMWMVVARGAALTATGLAIGLALAFALTRGMQTLLYGITAGDPVTFAVVIALLGAIALVACYVPARRAATVDPLVAIRSE